MCGKTIVCNELSRFFVGESAVTFGQRYHWLSRQVSAHRVRRFAVRSGGQPCDPNRNSALPRARVCRNVLTIVEKVLEYVR